MSKKLIKERDELLREAFLRNRNPTQRNIIQKVNELLNTADLIENEKYNIKSYNNSIIISDYEIEIDTDSDNLQLKLENTKNFLIIDLDKEIDKDLISQFTKIKKLIQITENYKNELDFGKKFIEHFEELENASIMQDGK